MLGSLKSLFWRLRQGRNPSTSPVVGFAEAVSRLASIEPPAGWEFIAIGRDKAGIVRTLKAGWLAGDGETVYEVKTCMCDLCMERAKFDEFFAGISPHMLAEHERQLAEPQFNLTVSNGRN